MSRSPRTIAHAVEVVDNHGIGKQLFASGRDAQVGGLLGVGSDGFQDRMRHLGGKLVSGGSR
jgi:hypothetical protein